MPDLRTGAEWDTLLLAKIMDPDGWDRSIDGGGPYFHTTKISLKDFEDRANRSTCMGRGPECNERVRLFRDIHRLEDFKADEAEAQ